MNIKRLGKISLTTALFTIIALSIFLLTTIRQTPAETTITEEIEIPREFKTAKKIEAPKRKEETIKQEILTRSATTTEIEKNEQHELILFDVPFTPQAPFANWDDPRQQDGCEEAASLMAVSWARGEDFTLAKAKSEIIRASEFEEEKYGEFRDTSAHDTAERIIKEYFQYNKYSVKKISQAEEIAKELKAGNIIIAPMNGQVLNNPFYTPPGPLRHMLVIRGYDPETSELITNDNGTRHGEGYRYAEDIFFNAIRDYPSGYHIPIEKVEKKIIIVRPENE